MGLGFGVDWQSYVEGGCDVFAVALHDELGYQPVAVRGYYRDSKGREQYETPHVAAQRPDGALVDALGVTSKDEMTSRSWYWTHDIERVDVVKVSRRQAGTSMTSMPGAGAIRHARSLIREHRRRF